MFLIVQQIRKKSCVSHLLSAALTPGLAFLRNSSELFKCLNILDAIMGDCDHAQAWCAVHHYMYTVFRALVVVSFSNDDPTPLTTSIT